MVGVGLLFRAKVGRFALETLRYSVEEELADVELPYQHLRGV